MFGRGSGGKSSTPPPVVADPVPLDVVEPSYFDQFADGVLGDIDTITDTARSGIASAKAVAESAWDDPGKAAERVGNSAYAFGSSVADDVYQTGSGLVALGAMAYDNPLGTAQFVVEQEVVAVAEDISGVFANGSDVITHLSNGELLDAGESWFKASSNAWSVAAAVVPAGKAKTLKRAAEAADLAKDAKRLGKAAISSGGGQSSRLAAKGGPKALPAPKARPAHPRSPAPEHGPFSVDPKGNVVPTPKGGSATSSPDGRFIQARDAAGKPTGVRLDGPHKPPGYTDPRSLQPHGHRPGVTNPDGTPWLPVH